MLDSEDIRDVAQRQKAQKEEARSTEAAKAKQRDLGFEVLGIAPKLVDRDTPTTEE